MLLSGVKLNFIFLLSLLLLSLEFTLCFEQFPTSPSPDKHVPQQLPNPPSDTDEAWYNGKKKEEKNKENKEDDDNHHAPAWNNEQGKQHSGDKDKYNSFTNSVGTRSHTIVTTVVVTTIESPTTIYTGENQPAKQQGDTEGSTQTMDPNSTTNQSPSSSNSSDRTPNDGRKAYRKLQLALSIVGSITGTILIVGIFLYTRKKIRNKRKKTEEITRSINSTPQGPIFPHCNHRSSMPTECRPYSFRDDSTVVDFSANPFSDMNKINVSQAGQITLTRTTSEPCLSSTYKINQTSFMPPLTSTIQPSAPPAEEIDINPFEDPNHFVPHCGHRSTPTQVRVSDLKDFHDEIDLGLPFPSHELPPPAYTLNITPTAPPLYALPGSSTSASNQQVLNRRLSESSTNSQANPSGLAPVNLNTRSQINNSRNG
jgi:hypothetical protein